MLANRKPSVLVVDDEPNVLELIRMYLTDAGLDVFTADGGRAALGIAADRANPIDLLLTDVIMPYMNGWDLANRIYAVRPYIKVIFISAYSKEILAANRLCPNGTDLIRKPFSKEMLLDRISQVWAFSPKWRELIANRA